MFAKNIIVGIAAVDTYIEGAEVATLLLQEQAVGADSQVIQRRAYSCAAPRNQLTLTRRKSSLVRKLLIVKDIFAHHVKLRHLDVGIVRQVFEDAAFYTITVFDRFVKAGVFLNVNIAGEKPVVAAQLHISALDTLVIDVVADLREFLTITNIKREILAPNAHTHTRM